MRKSVTVGFLVIVLAGCATAPVTGRSQLIIVSDAEERQMGLSAYQDVLKKAKLSKDAKQIEGVERVGRRIAQAAERQFHVGYDWSFSVIDDDKQVNAFCLPGGKVAVYTGILPVAGDDASLATVMAHEVAHAIARHGAERMTTGLLTQAGGQILAAGLGSPEAVQAAYGLGANLGVLLPFDRRQESEADHIGLILMARSGYDPHAALGFWQRMAKLGSEKGQPPEFLSTHPADERRIEQIRGWLPEAMEVYRPR